MCLEEIGLPIEPTAKTIETNIYFLVVVVLSAVDSCGNMETCVELLCAGIYSVGFNASR
jgi:hypothetical protein